MSRAVRHPQFTIMICLAGVVALAFCYKGANAVAGANRHEGRMKSEHWITSGPSGDSVFVGVQFTNTMKVALHAGVRWQLSAIYRPSRSTKAWLDSLKAEFDVAAKSGAEIHFNDGGPTWSYADGRHGRLPHIYNLVDPRDEQGYLRDLGPGPFVRGLKPNATIGDTVVFFLRSGEFNAWPGYAEVTAFLEMEQEGLGGLPVLVGDTLKVLVPLPPGHLTSR